MTLVNDRPLGSNEALDPQRPAATRTMDKRTLAPLLVILALCGCGKVDPATSKLEPGQVVVVATDEALLFEDGIGRPPTLAPGATARVGLDPGYFNLTQEVIDAKRKHNLALLDVDVSGGPRRFEPDHPSSGFRQVKVIIETGEQRGRSGSVYRNSVRPIP